MGRLAIGRGSGVKRVGGTKVARVLALVSALLFLYFAGVVFFRGWTELRAAG